MKIVSVAKVFIVCLSGVLWVECQARGSDTLNLWCAGFYGLNQAQDANTGYVDVPIGTETKLFEGTYSVSLEWDDNLYSQLGQWSHHTGQYMGFTVDAAGRVNHCDGSLVKHTFNGSRAAWEADYGIPHHDETRWTAYFNGQLLQKLINPRRGDIIGVNALTPEGFVHSKDEYFHLKPQGQCDACTTGTCDAPTSAATHSLDYTINLGRDRLNNEAASNQLEISTRTPFAQLATPSGLLVNFANLNGNETLYGPDNAPRQVVGPQTMADITTVNSFKYQVLLYPATVKGVKDPTSGLYVPTGTPTKTIIIENPDNSVAICNRLHITESTGDGNTASQRDYLFTYTGIYPAFDPNGQWDLVSQGGLRKESLVDHLIDPSNPKDRLETRTISDQTGKVVSQVQRRYHMYTWGEEITSETVDPNGAALTTTYDYWHVDFPDPSSPNPDPYRSWANHLKQKVDPNGHWERYEYDSLDRPTKKVVQFLDAPINAPDNQCRVTTTSYIDTAPLMETEVETLRGVEISRHHTRYLGQGRKQEIVCQHPGAAWNDANNLVTTTVTDPNGNVLLTQRPDGTLTTYSESVSDGAKTTITATGAPSADATVVVDGTRTTAVTDSGGHQLLQTAEDIASGLLLSSATTTQTDVWGRPTRVVYADGSCELTGYDCCGVSSRTDRDGVTTIYTNDAFSQVTSETRAGVTLLYTYDATGHKLTTVRRGSDQSTINIETLAYNVSGRQISRTDALGHVTTFAETIDTATGHTTRTTTLPDDAHSIRVETSFQDGSLLSVGGAAAHPLLYAYGADATAGAWRQEIRVGDGGAASEWTMTYTDPAGRGYKTLSAAGAVTQSFFNSQGQLSRNVDPDGVTTLYGYNARGEQDTVAIDMDRNDQIDFAANDRITRTTRSVIQAHDTIVARTTTSAWATAGSDAPDVIAVDEQSADGRSSWHTDSAGLTTSSVTSCNGAGTCTTLVTAPDGSYAVGVTQTGREVSQTRYDAHAQVLSGTTMEYDPQGRLWHQIDLRDGATTFTYDNGDQVRSVSHAGQTTSYDYDALGRKQLETQPDSGQVQTLYWPTGEVHSVSGIRTYPQNYTYNTQGRLTTLTTQGVSGAAITTWKYNAQSGRMVGKMYADGKGPTYSYSAAGRLATRTWARGIVTTYGNDNAGQLQSITYSDGTTPPAGYTYDRLGRLSTASGGGSTRTLSYQSSTNLQASESYMAGPLSGVSVNTGYDALLRRAGLQVTQGQTSLVSQSFGFDTASRLASASQGTANAAYVYQPNSAADLVQSITFGNSNGGNVQPVMMTSKSYDLLDRITSIASTVTGSSTPTASYAYTYNLANEQVRTDVAMDSTHWIYGYDELGQVTCASRQWSDGGQVGGQQFGYAYDLIGNRTSATVNGRQSVYTSNLLNEYTQRTVPGMVDITGAAAMNATVTLNGCLTVRQAGGYFYGTASVDNSHTAVNASIDVVAARTVDGSSSAIAQQNGSAFLPQTPEQYTYDDDGNVIHDGRWSYAWDAENRLSSIEETNYTSSMARKKLVFAYDAIGRRFQKQVWNWNATSGAYQLSSSRLFIYDSWNLIGELDGLNAGALIQSYLWGLDSSGTLRNNGGIGALLSLTENATSTGTQSHFICHDGGDSIVALIKANDKTCSAEYEYGPFGEEVRATGMIAASNPFRFSSQYEDIETKIFYAKSRYCSTATGRWLSRDPLGELGDVNLFAFVNNRPTSQIDPFGESGTGPGGYLGAAASAGEWMAGHNGGDTHYGPDTPQSVDMSKSNDASYLRGQFTRKNFGRVCKDWVDISNVRCLYTVRTSITNFGPLVDWNNGTAEFVGSARGDATILSHDFVTCTIKVQFKLTNTTDLNSLFGGLTPISWNVTAPSAPFTNWTQTYEWVDTFHCKCCALSN